jgi:GT2 family glycosyltransferase
MYDAAGAGGTFQESDPLLADIRQRHPLPTTMQLDVIGLVGNGGNIMYKREWLERCATCAGQIFDETIFKSLAEDWEFVHRLREQGARLAYVPNPVLHLRRATAWGHLRQQFYRGKGIALLFKLHRASSSDLIAHDSLLWGNAGVKRRPAWLMAVWRKLIGPFDAHHFSSWRNFWLFWLGEKFQSLGFLWGLLRLRYEKPASSIE